MVLDLHHELIHFQYVKKNNIVYVEEKHTVRFLAFQGIGTRTAFIIFCGIIDLLNVFVVVLDD